MRPPSVGVVSRFTGLALFTLTVTGDVVEPPVLPTIECPAPIVVATDAHECGVPECRQSAVAEHEIQAGDGDRQNGEAAEQREQDLRMLVGDVERLNA